MNLLRVTTRPEPFTVRNALRFIVENQFNYADPEKAAAAQRLMDVTATAMFDYFSKHGDIPDLGIPLEPVDPETDRESSAAALADLEQATRNP